MQSENPDDPRRSALIDSSGSHRSIGAQASINEDYSRNNLIEIPSISTPKGGGALRSIDEKFEVNGANGTSSFSIPIPFSKSRSDFTPSLSLSYNSGGGNSPFGLGWNISLPSIRRRTDKLLPQYQDATDGDVFQLAGVEDLVVKLAEDSQGEWQPDSFTAGDYTIKRYRPRIEGGFMRIEQVSSTHGVYWKTTGKDNTVTFYGLSASGRIAHPDDPSKIYEWLPELSFDDKGNCYRLFYLPEDLVNVPAILHEGNRLNGNQGIANSYLKKIVYGNTKPYAGPGSDPYWPILPDAAAYLFSLVLDYGDHDLLAPDIDPSGNWDCRLDPFSNGKPGFDLRTYRLCRRFLLFHQFAELGPDPVLVRSLDLNYQHYDFQPAVDLRDLTFIEADLIRTITATGWVKLPAGGYQSRSYPPFTFTYNMPIWNTDVEMVDAGDRMNIPEGLTTNYQFTDLWDEGISGILSERAGGWYYNSNLGNGVFTPASLVSPKPSFTGLNGGGLQLQSLTGDGRKFIVSMHAPNQGFFLLTDGEEWLPFRSFERFPRVDIGDPNVKFIDLNGDGMAEIVLSEEEVFTWYPATGVTGYDSPELTHKPFDEEKGPAIVFSDPVQSIFLADMTGDGLTDIVRIRNGEIAYWPNRGFGRFGAKVNMSNAPVFDSLELFNPSYLHLADINGTGATDILYLGQDRFRAWLNLSGNAWGLPFEMPAFPDTGLPNQVAVTDLLGNGTACITWSSPLSNNADSPLRYIDLMGGNKPYVMNGYANGMGKEVAIAYKSSTWYYLRDKLAGRPWITKLGFPVQCVAGTWIHDTVSGSIYSSSYSYHHGYYDHLGKEFRGFGRVEQTDTDTFDSNAVTDQAPVLTKTWFHTGAYFGIDRILNQYREEYFQNPFFAEHNLPEPLLPACLTTDEYREAARACKGMTLRQEVYALDAVLHPELAPYPYSAAEHNNRIGLLQPRAGNLYAVFLVTESEAITYHYERNPADPRIAHALNTAFDEYGNITDAYSVVYGRQSVDPFKPGGLSLPGGQPLPAAVMLEQKKTFITYTHNGYTEAIIGDATYRLPVSCETVSYQLTGVSPSGAYFTPDDLLLLAGAPVLIKLTHQRVLFLRDDLVTILPLYQMDSMGMVYQQYHLAFDQSVVALAGKADKVKLAAANYVRSDDYKVLQYFPATDANNEWWVPSGTIGYLNGGLPLPFFLPYQYLDTYGFPTTLAYDGYWLLMQSVTDALLNVHSVGACDYRVLSPLTVLDPNGNATDIRYDVLGHVAGLALRGKGEGDVFDAGFSADLSDMQVAGFLGDPYGNGPGLLQGATTRFFYIFPSAAGPATPFSVGSMTRVFHANAPVDPRVDKVSVPYQYSFEYTDGLGRTAMKKVQADLFTGKLAASIDCDGGNLPQHRWIGNGKTVYNNKGKPVMQYEPFFSPAPAYEIAPANGVSPVLQYDPVGRVIRTDLPDGSFSTTVFDAWVEIGYDPNDTVLDSAWYQQAIVAADPMVVAAAKKAVEHSNTPSASHLDALGRKFYSVAFNIVGGVNTFPAVQTVLDLRGNALQVMDAMGLTVMQYEYDLLNRPIHQFSMDAGERWMLHDSMDKALFQWDNNGAYGSVYQFEYDQLHRILHNYVTINGVRYLFGYNVYGEGAVINGASDTDNNLRGKPFMQFDDSGLNTCYHYDFKGNVVQSSRTFAVSYQSADPFLPVNNWSGVPLGEFGLLEANEYTSLTEFDAVNRVMLQVRPFVPAIGRFVIPFPYTPVATAGAEVIVPVYGESGHLNQVKVYEGGGDVASIYVTRICHNEKGQRHCIQYGNNTVTKYHYDTNNFRLIRLVTTANFGAAIMQDLRYYYDPAGNITSITDNAQAVIYFGGTVVKPAADYTYDAIYQLTQAIGREHLGQNVVMENNLNKVYRDFPFSPVAVPKPGDTVAMRNYTQKFTYDAAGNIRVFDHKGDVGPGYVRTYFYNNNDADRLACGVPAAAVKNNRLLRTAVGAVITNYTYDEHGNMGSMPHLSVMSWNFKDQLCVTATTVMNDGSAGDTYYTYDGSGIRTRKITVSQRTGRKVAERLYLQGFEIYRGYTNDLVNPDLERLSLHIMDDKSRVALVETKMVDKLNADTTVVGTPYSRYQYSNHLGSACLELDDTARIISYEEYHPYGTTSFQAKNAVINPVAKRYRYTGLERDEENGLGYHNARYYVPWLGRWANCDPSLIKDGLNIYEGYHSNPVKYTDQSGMGNDPATPSADRRLRPRGIAHGKIVYESATTLKNDPLFKDVAKTVRDRLRSNSFKNFSRNLHAAVKSDMTLKLDSAFANELEIKSGRLHWTSGPFKGQRLDLAHTLGQEVYKNAGGNGDVPIDLDNISPTGQIDHLEKLHVEERATDYGKNHTPEAKAAIRAPESEAPSKLPGGGTKSLRVDVNIENAKPRSFSSNTKSLAISSESPFGGSGFDPMKIPQESPRTMELDPRPSYALIGVMFLHDLAEKTHHTEDDESWKWTIAHGPGPVAARLSYEAIEGAFIVGDAFNEGTKVIWGTIADTAKNIWE